MHLRPKVSDNRFTWFVKWPFWLPVLCVSTTGRWVKRLFVKPRTPSEQRDDATSRQKKVRRGLRGLTTEHDQTRRGP